MTTRYFGALAVAALLVNGACAQSSPTAPEAPASTAIAPDGGALTSSSYVVTLLPDMTASPSTLTITAGYKVLFVNKSGRNVALHSYNCTEFTYMSLNAGYSKNTLPFNPAGKTCDYSAYDASYQKIFVGQVAVR